MTAIKGFKVPDDMELWIDPTPPTVTMDGDRVMLSWPDFDESRLIRESEYRKLLKQRRVVISGDK